MPVDTTAPRRWTKFARSTPLGIGMAFACVVTETAVATGDSSNDCPLVDDQQIRIQSPADVTSMRSALRQYIWGQPSLPTNAAVVVTPNVPSPIGCSSGVLDHVDALRIDMPTASAGTVVGNAWHFVPATANGVVRRDRLVVVHNGHMVGDACSYAFADGEDGLNWSATRPYAGLQMTINALLADGYDVLAVSMPQFVAEQCTFDHGTLFAAENAPPAGSGMRYFLDPTLRSLNYLLDQHAFVDVSMTGLSGGGWTTTVYAAVDPRIRLSIPVAGSIPLHLRNGAKASAFPGLLAGAYAHDARTTRDASPQADCSANTGDAEQTDPTMYTLAGYPELYLLGAYGEDREQIQILNRNDGCCFGEAQHYDPAAYDSDLRSYERAVRERLAAIGNPASFSVRIDEQAAIHQISRDATHAVILTELNRARDRIGATNSDNLFVRGANGNILQRVGQAWNDTGLDSSGTPAVVENTAHGVDVVYRDASNRPRFAYHDGTSWVSVALIASDGSANLPRGRVIGAPVAVASANGGFDVFALGAGAGSSPGADLYRWEVSPLGQHLELVAPANLAVGRIATLAGDSTSDPIAYLRNAEYATTDPAPIPPYATSCIERPITLYAAPQPPRNPSIPLERLPLSPGLSSFAAARRYEDTIRLYYTSQSGELWEASSASGASPWLATRISGSMPMALTGTPAVSTTTEGLLQVHVRTQDSKLVRFAWEVGEVWQAETIDVQGGTRLRDSPTAIAGGVAWTGIDGKVYTRIGDRVFTDGFDGN